MAAPTLTDKDIEQFDLKQGPTSTFLTDKDVEEFDALPRFKKPLSMKQAITGGLKSPLLALRSLAIMRPSSEEAIAKAQNVYSISKLTGLPRIEVEKNYESFARRPDITGLTPDQPTSSQLTSLLLTPAIGAGLITHPRSIIGGLLTFSAIDKLIPTKKFIPSDISDTAKTTIELIDFIGKGLLTGGILKKAPSVARQFTKTKITQFNLPTKMYVSQNDLQGLSEYEFRDLFQKQLNLPSKQLRNIFLARNTGKNIEIELPAGDTVSIVDRPYWAKIKGLFKIKPFAEVVSTPAGIKARQEVLLLQAKERFVSPSVVAPAQKLLPPPVQKVRELAKAIPETIDINTPERQMLRQGIIDKFSMKGTEDKEKIVDIVLGLPASGKNAYIAKPLSEATNALLIDSDIYKKELPEYNKGIGAEATHKESSDIIESSITEKAVSSGVNIVLPRLGKNYNTIKNLIEAFKEKGYTVNLHFVDLPTEKAVARAEQRYWEGGNFVDPDFIRKLDLTLLENYDRLKLEKGVDSYGKYSTDVQKGEEAKLIESSSNYQPLRLRSRRLRDSSISKGREESEAPSEVISLPVSKPSALPLTDQDIAKIDQGIKPAINW